ncbi:MAG: PQQ-binding-like beta-propeller repeat protein, partial [Deltaproteobacteria bacterium]|nr:PQQ-binding-like beta-propeller repeat protein [Deltaproteobacteria bacterium]
EASIQYSLNASEEDRSTGGRIFRERCTACHGIDGSGGPVGPSLTRPQYKHGDSDLAIYQILRDGITGTAMPRAGLPPRELLQVIAYVKMLQAHSPSDREPEPRLAIHVSSERLRAAGTDPDEWLMYSGSYNGWRHTALAEITPANVSQLRIRWIKQFDNTSATIEATPLVIDGVIFMVVEPGHVVALNDKTGEVVWEYKRPVPPDLPLIAGPVNRGLAVHGSTIFLGTVDGYLIAINANDGKVIWERLVGSPADGYSVTGAPLVVDGSVVVGVAGADYGIRGFLAAYDVLSGREQWRFETIPGPGEVGHETWENDAWRTGGGSTWNTGSYDPLIDLLYWGVGNPAPSFSGDVRPGDNLFTDSVIALHARTGKLAWSFQFTPHDEHDWDSAQTPVLADLPIDGVVRKVICWPNRNGFYYVLDRITGEFLAGVPFVEVDWAKGLTSSGRPILADVAQASTAGIRTRPGAGGGTTWQNPAFDPKRGFIFVPATESSSVFTKLPPDSVTRGQKGLFQGSGATEKESAINQVVALDAVTGRPKWKFTSPSGIGYSGVLSTEGGLVFGASGGAFFCGGRGHRTRSLARLTWRVYQVRSDLIYGRRTTGGCSRSRTRAIHVWAVDPAVHRTMHNSFSVPAAPLKVAFNIDGKEPATAY